MDRKGQVLDGIDQDFDIHRYPAMGKDVKLGDRVIGKSDEQETGIR